MPDIFLSYSRDDLSTARLFAQGFERQGLTVWWDQTLDPGEAFDEVTEKALNDARAVVVLWSKKSVASRWVRAEATQANDNKTLVPVMIEPCKRPIMFELTHSADLTNWQGDPDDPAWQSFLAGVRRLLGKEAAGAPSPAGMSGTARPLRQFGVRTLIGLVALLVATAAVTWWVWPRQGKQPIAPAASAPSNAPIRLGVLPFTTLSSDSDQGYLSEGLAEDLAIQLNQIRALRALGPASTRRFSGSKEDPRAIATALDVSEVLMGTVRRNEHQWLFTVNLIDGKDGTPRWSERYEGEDVFALQEKIVKDVAQAVGIVLGVTDYPRTQGGTENVKAYEQYMRARYLWRIGGLTPVAAKQMALYLREAVRLDPGYMRAWLTLYLTLRQIISTGSADAIDGLRQERVLAARQLEKMPQGSVLALRFRAFRMLEQHNWSDSVAAAEATMAAAPPNDFDSNYALGLILMCVGRIEASLPYLRRAVEAEPLHAEVSGNLQLALIAAGREADAREEMARARALGVNSPFADLPSWEDVRSIWPQRPDGKLEWPFEDIRPPLRLDAKAARQILHTRMAESAQDSLRGSSMLLFFLGAALGEWDLAMTTVRDALASKPEATLNTFFIWQGGIPRGSQTFKSVARDLGLVNYWRTSGKWNDFCKPVGKDDFECH